MTPGDPDPDARSGRGPLPDRYRYKPMAAAYQGALEAVFSIVLTTAAGYYADDYFDTSPWLLVGGATIGFAAFVLRLTRLGKALNQAASDAAPEPGPETAPDESASELPDGDSSASRAADPRD